MRLEQLHNLRLWHQRHLHAHPVEKHVWDIVMLLWLMGWVGAPTAFLIHLQWAVVICIGLVFLPGAYAALRKRLHRVGVLRCDWIGALR